ncbi:zinc-dependent metalloprotease [Chryseobacterium wanjuense]
MRFDGQQQLTYGLMGYAMFPDAYDFSYESFMKVATIKNTNDTTLTHELGHAFGLFHTFQGVNYNNQTSCPANNNCATDGDKVCDTSPSRSMYGVAVPDNSSIDPCTGQNYDGTQYNIMNYTNANRKFTDGQRDRALLLMMEYRKNLLNSTAGKDPSIIIPSPVSIISAQCNPPGTAHPTNNNFAIGPNRVIFGSINSITNGYDSDEAAPVFYADYSTATCIRPAYYTDIPSNSATPINVYYINGVPQSSAFRTKVWIDYNNNGAFDASELVVNNTSASLASGAINTITANITPPANAVKNTYLRMRVAVDAATFGTTPIPDFDACSQLQYGQMEDYSVRVMDVLGTSEVKDHSETKIVFVKGENKLKLVGNKNDIFGDYQILDMSGKIIQKGNSKTNEVQMIQELPKGGYIVSFSNNNKKESKKFLNN